jgi:zinc transport system substrate-binding protein
MSKKYIGGIILGIVFVGLFILLINNKKPVIDNSIGKIKVTASFYPLYFFANQIGGDKANVINITPSGAEPHNYEPTPRDIASIENSKILILEGNGLEAWGKDIQSNINPKNTTVITVGQDLITQNIVENGNSVIDPHIWLSPSLASEITEKILAGFIAIDPINKEYYQNNEEKLKAKLAILDTEYKKGLANCVSKDIVTSHAAFGYLAASYGLIQVPISGLSPDAEPSPKQLADITDFVKKNNVKYIFFENLVSPKFSETVAQETRTKTMVLDPIEGITKEDLAKGYNYLTVMEKNLHSLQKVLQCQ